MFQPLDISHLGELKDLDILDGQIGVLNHHFDNISNLEELASFKKELIAVILELQRMRDDLVKNR
ncbi:MAG: hypothetical protein ACQR33_03070 [Candidatus Saccharibacteria bacterium]